MGEKSALNTLLRNEKKRVDEVPATEEDAQQEALQQIFHVQTVELNSPFLRDAERIRQREQGKKVDDILRAYEERLGQHDPNEEVAKTILKTIDNPQESFSKFDIFKTFPENERIVLSTAYNAAEMNLKRAMRLEKIDTLQPETWDANTLDDLENAGMPPELLLLQPTEYPTYDTDKQKQSKKLLARVLRPINAWRKKNEVVQEAQKAQRAQIEKFTDKAMNTFINQTEIALGNIRTMDTKTGLTNPDDVKKYQSLLESTATLLTLTEKTVAVFDREKLTKLHAAVAYRLEVSQKYAEDFGNRKENQKRAEITDAIGRIESTLRLNSIPLTTEIFQRYEQAIAKLESDYSKLLPDEQPSALFTQKRDEALKLLKERRWKTLSLGAPYLLRRQIYEGYEARKNIAGEKVARDWLKMALEILEEVAEQQKTAFLKSWDVLWGQIENTTGYARTIPLQEIDQVFFENNCNFSPHALGIADVLKSAVEANNTTLEVLQQLHNDPIEVFRALQKDGTARDPHGRVEIDRRQPCLAVRLICYDPIDYTLLSQGVDIQDASNAARELGLAYIHKQSFNVNGQEKHSPLILINGNEHIKNNANMDATVRHETAHRKMIVQTQNEDITVVGEERQRKEEDTVFALERSIPIQQGNWRDKLNKQYKSGLLSARDEIQAFTEELDYDFPQIEEHLLKTGPDAFYEYVAPDGWVQEQINLLDRVITDTAEAQRLKVLLQADVDKAKAAYAKRLKEAMFQAQKIANLFPQTIQGRAKVGAILRFSTITEWQKLSRYLS